jgi:hypothetical protein
MDVSKVIHEFVLEGKDFMYIDMSEIETNKELIEYLTIIEKAIAKYPLKTLYTVTNITNVRFDAEIKEHTVPYLEHNAKYVKHAAIIGPDGITKTIASTIFKLSQRDNVVFAFTKEQAVELLLQKD